MTLFGIGPIELLVILILALIVFGPSRLPEIARSLGKAMSELRRTSQEVTTTVMRELDAAPGPEKPQKAVPPIPASVQDAAREIVGAPQETPSQESRAQASEAPEESPAPPSQDIHSPDEG